MTMTREQIRLNAQKELSNLIKPGDTIYFMYVHKPKKGIVKTVVVLIVHEGKIKNVSSLVHDVSTELNNTWDANHSGISTSDAYMITYCLSLVLHGQVDVGNPSSETKQNPVPGCYFAGHSLKRETI